MEWVETTGRTVDEAKKAALEQLGVDESDADVEVIAEPKIGLFNRLKEEARVRARISPRYPRSKGERRDRKRSRPGQDSKLAGGEGAGVKARQMADVAGATAAPARKPEPVGDGAATGGAGRRRPHTNPATRRAVPGTETSDDEGASFGEVTTVTSEEQAQLAEEFLRGLLKELGTTGTVTSEQSEGTVDVSITGDDLGTLIGPKGTTLLALQELTRTVVQRQAVQGESRIVVDINGYRKKRHEALARFAKQVAAEVVASNNKRALEPMPSADRKVVHDAVTGIDGVTSTSEGEEPYRRVVLVPSAGTTSDD